MNTEKYLERLSRQQAIQYVTLRYFNAAGADPEGEIGEEHDPETHLIPIVLLAALEKVPEIKIFGGDYDTPDGTCVRDYVHVEDLAEAHVLALKWLEQGNPSETFNLGNGNGYSVNEVINLVEKVSGKKVPFSKEPRRPGDLAIQVADSTKAIEQLKWNPRYASLESIIDSAWRWYSS